MPFTARWHEMQNIMLMALCKTSRVGARSHKEPLQKLLRPLGLTLTRNLSRNPLGSQGLASQGPSGADEGRKAADTKHSSSAQVAADVKSKFHPFYRVFVNRDISSILHCHLSLLLPNTGVSTNHPFCSADATRQCHGLPRQFKKPGEFWPSEISADFYQERHGFI